MIQFAAPILALGLVSPGFLAAGALLVAVPILIHILNRRRFKTVTWAAMEYLLRAMRKNRRRLKFEQWLLLATRCAVLVLLGLALARPLGCESSSLATMGGRTGMSVFVIDNSYSMGYRVNRGDAVTHLDAAKVLAKAMIDRLSPGGEAVAVVTAASPATAVIARPGYDLSAAKAAIDRIEQSAGGTDMAGALQLALQIGREAERQPNKNLHLLSDSTSSAWRKEAQAEAIKQAAQELAKVYRVSHHNLAQGLTQWNAAVLSVKPNANLVTNKFLTTFTADVKGFGPAPRGTLQWRLGERELDGVDNGAFELSPETPAKPQTNATFRSGGPQVMTVSVVPSDAGATDRLPVDNTRHRVIDVASELKVLIVEGERGINPLEGSGAFLQIALAPPKQEAPPTTAPAEPPAEAPGARATNSYVAPELISDLELGNKVLGDYSAVILTDVGQVSPAQADALQNFVRQGGTLMLFMGKQIEPENYNSVMLPRKLMPGTLVKRMSTAADQSSYLFDFNPSNPVHPFLGEFRDTPNSGLQSARTFGYWQVEIPANSGVERVLNFRQDGGTTEGSGGRPIADPAFTIHSLGEGRVVFASTTASPDPDWTTFPAKPAYVPLMHELLAGSVRTGDHWLNLTVGQSLTVPPTVRLTATPTLVDADNRPIVMDAVAAADGSRETVHRSRPLTRPGLYTLSVGSRRLPVAVNVPSDEADVRPVPDEALREALGGIDVSLLGRDLPSDEEMAQAGNDFGWNFMVLVLVLLGVECFLAMRFGHYRRSDAVRGAVAAAA